MYSEKQLIGRIQSLFAAATVPVSIGDDAAVVDLPADMSTVLCADLLVEDTHFRRNTHPPHAIGFKAVAVNVSDVGAMGGTPIYCLLSLAVPAGLDTTWIDRFFEGFRDACDSFHVQLVGGDSAVAERIFIDVSMIGRVPSGAAVRRRGAQVGDGVYVTGKLGGAARGFQLLARGDIRNEIVNRHLYPTPRHQIAQQIAPHATAMIDISDGFSIDLGHILEASHVSARIQSSTIPCDVDTNLSLALHGGEDYELIFTGSGFPGQIQGVPITQVGEIIESRGSDLAYLVRDSREEILPQIGWQHFR